MSARRYIADLCRSCGLLLVVSCSAIAADDVALSLQVDFERQVRPLLANYCFACHGPDAAARQGGLRLDDPAIARSTLASGHRAIVSGRPDVSELVRRITSPDPDVRMPPDGEKELTASEVELLSRWIEQGAVWNEHWAFQAPRRPQVPLLRTGWSKNPIDSFVLQPTAHGSSDSVRPEPAPEADRVSLIRRVTFDLNGLPPTVSEVEAFLSDDRPDAYERVVERLLASPRYGERMATPWLDAARYADTNGYEQDNGRTMWAWRDWVIDALNDNMPFHRFTIEQLAGDLLPNATFAQRLATGLHRNHGLNFEGGSISEESRWNYVCDRVDTTATIWLGLTIGCARCHNHKYDPISQREYYNLAAFFNNVAEEGYAGEKGNALPTLKLDDQQQAKRLEVVEHRLRRLDQQIRRIQTGHDAERDEWKRNLLTGRESLPTAPDDYAVYCPLDVDPSNEIWDHANRNEAAHVTGTIHWISGQSGDAVIFDGQTSVNLGERGAFERDQPFSIAAWIQPASSAFGPVLGKIYYQGYDLCWFDGRVQVNLVNRWDNNAIFVQTKQQFPLDQWHHVLVTYNGSSKAAGITIYINGQLQELDITKDCLTDSIASTSPLQLGARSESTPERFIGAIDDVRLYARELSSCEAVLLAQMDSFYEAIAAGKLRAAQEKILDDYYLKHLDPQYTQLQTERAAAELEKAQVLEAWPTTMVMEELESPRTTHVLQRGLYNQPQQAVQAGTPAVLPPLPADQPPSRLTLAKWLVSADHPLTARVIVNRQWEMFFGTGIVSTLDDFGVQGSRPSNPQLLDWLAIEFIESNWDLKHLHRLIVTSAAYRQASSTSVDADTSVLRPARTRLPAEMIRDAALAHAGLLSNRIGGPGVMPYQPADLWGELSFRSTYTAQEYQQSTGEDLYRRSVYTYCKRTCPHPAMQSFDVGDRQVCQVSRTSTNTPLQALVLMNDATFVEAAKMLANESIRKCGAKPTECIQYAFCKILSRKPNQEELRLLVELWNSCRADLEVSPSRVGELLSVGEGKIEDPHPLEVAAATLVIHAILVLDEAITRN